MLESNPVCLIAFPQRGLFRSEEENVHHYEDRLSPADYNGDEWKEKSKERSILE